MYLFLMCCGLNYFFSIHIRSEKFPYHLDGPSEGLDVQVRQAAHESDGSGTGSSEVRVGPCLSPRDVPEMLIQEDSDTCLPHAF